MRLLSPSCPPSFLLTLLLFLYHLASQHLLSCTLYLPPHVLPPTALRHPSPSHPPPTCREAVPRRSLPFIRRLRPSGPQKPYKTEGLRVLPRAQAALLPLPTVHQLRSARLGVQLWRRGGAVTVSSGGSASAGVPLTRASLTLRLGFVGRSAGSSANPHEQVAGRAEMLRLERVVLLLRQELDRQELNNTGSKHIFASAVPTRPTPIRHKADRHIAHSTPAILPLLPNSNVPPWLSAISPVPSTPVSLEMAQMLLSLASLEGGSSSSDDSASHGDRGETPPTSDTSSPLQSVSSLSSSIAASFPSYSKSLRRKLPRHRPSRLHLVPFVYPRARQGSVVSLGGSD